MPDRHLLPNERVPHEAQHAAFDEHHANYKTEIWDRKSPINGVPAEHWLGRDDVRDGEVYLIHYADDSGTLIFQPHHPNGAVMTKETVQATADRHHEDVAADRAHAALQRQFPEAYRPAAI
jgi:hypothetical protein